tara:strand:- start:2775 stop:3986 length:1212 start_codon:yes stop_codon:yes gene_type:complete
VADAVKIDGVDTGDIVSIDGVAKTSIIKIGTSTIPAGVAGRWMAGGRLGYVYTTTASNGLNGWGDGPGLDGNGARGGFIIDIGEGLTNSIAYGEDTSDPPVPRWMLGFELETGPKGNTAFINSSSAHDGAGLPYYATASNWTSASVPFGNSYISNGQIGFGNGTWVRGGKQLADGGEFRNIGRSTNGGALFNMLDTNNTVDDYCRAVCYEGGTSGNWLALVQSHVWKSEDDGDTWTDLGALDGTKDWYTMAYDGAGRWVVAGASGDGWTSIVPIADMTDVADDWDEISAQLNTAQNIYGLVYMKGSVNKWISAGANGQIKTTAFTASARGAGDTWDTPSTPDTQQLNDIATDHVTAVAVGAQGRIWSSTDATNWTAAVRNDNIGTEQLFCIACDIVGAGKTND